jgi:DNA-binding CsgD family transcriptional regulator
MTAVAPELVPADEERRLFALHSYEILDTPPEQAYDDLTSLAALVCGTSMASLTLIDAARQWFKSAIGLGVPETPRDGFCAHCILQPDVLIVGDACRDARFARHPFVIGDPHIRFYAGVTLVSSDGFALGTLCAIDARPCSMSPAQVDGMRALGRQAVAQLELRRLALRSGERIAELRELYGHALAAGAPRPGAVPRPVGSLTDQELVIVRLVAQGLSNPEIGLRLHLSRHTVKEYLGNAMRKLRAGSRVEAALLAARCGLIELMPPTDARVTPRRIPRGRSGS